MNYRQDLPAIIDVEASGFGKGSYPIELGVVLSCGARLSMLVKPEPEWIHWDANAESLHGLSRQQLVSTGKPIKSVATAFNAFLSGMTVYTDAWVVDGPWISHLFYAAGTKPRFKVSSIEQIMSEAQFEIWDDTKTQLADELQGTRHRASQDAWLIQQTYAKTRAMLFRSCVLQRQIVARQA
jgi:hypothetical protein